MEMDGVESSEDRHLSHFVGEGRLPHVSNVALPVDSPRPQSGRGAGGEGTPLGEFTLIERFFARPTTERQGIGDDCALIDVGSQTLALTSDMLLEGVHFLPDADPQDLGHKALAVNLSDLAAAGATPRCFLLDLALPRADAAWLESFSRGLFALAQAHSCTLIGGDTTRAPDGPKGPGSLTIAITAIGEVERDRYRGRSGAQPGDDIWITGSTGEAALALAVRRGQIDIAEPARTACLLRMDRPTPRVALGQALLGTATASVDVSDGLMGDLGHILERSGVGAVLYWPAVPRAPVFDTLPLALQYQCVLAGGDDYELIFTAPVSRRAAIARMTGDGVGVSRIGQIEIAPGLRLRNGDQAGAPLIDIALQSFDHFASPTPGE
jgi:thiamine-monophosphate kinase